MLLGLTHNYQYFPKHSNRWLLHNCPPLLKMKKKSVNFYCTALYARGLSYCRAVCLSVRHMRELWQKTNESSARILIPYERSIHLIFRHVEWLVGDILLYLKFWDKPTSPASKTAIFNQFSFIAPQPLQLSAKSPIMTNRKSTTSFPMSLRWTAYVAFRPPEGAQKRKLTIFL